MQKPTFREALLFWIRLGFISFGGPAGQIAIMHEFLVEKKRWISDSKFLHALNYCMILPGPEAQQLATYIGWMLHGTRGGLVAGILFVLPSMFILLALSSVYVSFGNLPWIAAMFNGLKPAVIAIVILALIKIGRRSLISPFHYFVALLAFICIFFFNIPFPLIIIGAVVLAAITRQLFSRFLRSKREADMKADALEEGYYLNAKTILPGTGFRPVRLIIQIGTAVVLWILPLGALCFFASDFPFWRQLSLFFTQAAVVTFGGAYAVLPYVAQVTVEKFHWLTEFQMIDGLALGETTPGPLIMVLAFVGFMAGYNHFGNSLAMGALGLSVTTFYTFLPCFLFIFAGVPLIERTQGNRKIAEMLSLVTAAVVGVILNLTIYLGKAVIFSGELSLAGIDYITIGWIIASFIAIYHYKVNMISWLFISAFFGLFYYLLANETIMSIPLTKHNEICS